MKEKQLKDYYDAVCERFPDIPRKDIERILVRGMRFFYHTNLYGGDTLFQYGSFWMYCGKLFNSAITACKYWMLKIRAKIRYQYIIKKEPFDGYYYFGIPESRFNEYTDQLPKSKRGGRRRKFTFENIMLYKVLDELVTLSRNYKYKYVFRVYLNVDVGWECYRETFTSNQIKLFATIDKNQKIKYLENE